MVGVGAVVFDDQNRILLIKRGKPPHYGSWMVPGGTLEWGETLERAVVREVREETGIEIEIESFVELIQAIDSGEPGYHFVIADFAAHAKGGVLRAASDALDAIWVPTNSLDQHDLNPQLRAVIAKARQMTGRGARPD